MNYEELVKALRDIEKTMFALGTSSIKMDNVSIRLAYDKKWGRTAKEAAAAIEELQAAEPTEKQVVDYCHKRCLAVIEADFFNELKASYGKLPKRGKWITHPEVKNIYGGVYIECPFCGEKYVVQNVSDEKFCRNCGADMRAKMEVQIIKSVTMREGDTDTDGFFRKAVEAVTEVQE